MNLRAIDQNIFVAGQIDLEDLSFLAQQGIKTIICNRPDHEEPAQLTFNQIAQAAKEYAMTAHYIPVTPPAIPQTDINALSEILVQSQKPILLYCRSGARSQHIYQLAKQ